MAAPDIKVKITFDWDEVNAGLEAAKKAVEGLQARLQAIQAKSEAEDGPDEEAPAPAP